MPEFSREVAGQVETVTVSDDLAPYHRARGWVEVVVIDGAILPADQAAEFEAARVERAEFEQHVAELAGADLDKAAKRLGVPVSLHADEKRAAILEAADAPAVPVVDFDGADDIKEN